MYEFFVAIEQKIDYIPFLTIPSFQVPYLLFFFIKAIYILLGGTSLYFLISPCMEFAYTYD